MTDFKDDEKASQKEPSFKDKILAELEEANRLRQQREEELYRREQEAKRAAQEEAALEAKRVEEARLEEERLIELKRQEAERLAAAQALIAEQKAEEERLLRERQEAQARALKEAEEAKRLEAEQKAREEQEAINAAIAAESARLLMERDAARAAQEQAQEVPEQIQEVEETVIEPEQAETQIASEESPVTEEVLQVSDDLEETEEVVENLKPTSKRQRKNRIAAKISAILISVIVLVACLAAFFGYRYVDSALGAADSSATEYVTVDIPSGSGNKYIGQILEQNGIIKDATIFNYYTKFKNISDLQSGYYNLKASMTVDEIIKALQAGGTSQPEEPVAGKILVTEGYTIQQISEAITKNVNTSDSSTTPFSSEDFLKLMKDETFIAKMVAKYPDLLSNLPSASEATYQLEGYLFPATYNYYDDTTLEGLVEEMISTMDSYMSSYYSTIKSSGYNVNQILTLASLVEKEGSTDDDRRNIASVFYNRLNANMPLQSNIAILYAMGKLGEETTLKEDTTIDTSIDSPYNIYTNTGLMPGPVDSPSLSAIEATVNPASTNYLYFVADVTTGKVYYSEDYDTHLQNVEKYINSQVSDSSS
ncbi:endolytic transglycosylase MltG [Streptococcus loxodontisalivarius]|uniref:Endolytic murein transglycosylase n=1 Tax=Streptococcus loxodontisalivarius TaxID=1349415 RepID=A0ABS2PVZ1_9STRE|nr:endolytic transglycosylase MltG [Streptococcus loxodontisalivarius]MBM7643695.1 UPF0755 protein [Streptococcus loxodontisalivarius]